MSSKARVLSRAKTVGATVEIDHYEVTVTAPAGKTMDGLHYSTCSFGAFEYKSDIWEMLLDELRNIKDCNCGCAEEETN